MTDSADEIRKLIRDSMQSGTPADWFEQVYAAAEREGWRIPWARFAPDPDLLGWLAEQSAPAAGTPALVIGCGLGDDAEAIARAGYTVTAFDISPTAIDACRARFPGSPVRYVVADLLALPDEWRAAYRFVFESRTIQALPWDYTEPAIRAIAACVAPGGDLLVCCLGREPEEDRRGIPWPLSRAELALFETHGMAQTRWRETDDNGRRRFCVAYRRP